MKKWLILSLICLIAVGAGAVVPQVFPMGDETEDAAEAADGAASTDDAAAADGAAGDAGAAEGDPAAAVVDPNSRAFVPYEMTSLNLNDEQLIRYLAFDFDMETTAIDKDDLIKRTTELKPVLKSWLIQYVADLTIKDLRGRAGINKIRREIQDNFNNLLYPNGDETIIDIHLTEFNVQ